MIGFIGISPNGLGFIGINFELTISGSTIPLIIQITETLILSLSMTQWIVIEE